MKRLWMVLCLVMTFAAAQASTYIVATSGSDANPGTIQSPYATIAKAVAVIAPGDTIFVRAGTYATTARLTISKIGSSAHMIYLWSYPGDMRPVIDFSSMPLNSSNQGVLLNNASYWHVKGLRIRGAGDNGMQISGGGNNTIEFCDFFENRDAGLQLKNGTHDNRIINCDSYWNADYVAGSSTYTGGNADGFSPKLDVGTGNYFYGCRSWLNSDDGWDGFLSADLNISTTIERCWSWKNGYLKDGVTTTSSMNGNGFKTGGGWSVDSAGVKHYVYRHNQTLINCLSFNNKAKGFDQNHNVGTLAFLNCTGIANGANNFDITQALASGCTLTVKNSISYEANKVALLSAAVTATNSWTSGGTVTSADFVTLDTTGISALRHTDGSLPDVAFMHLARGSRLIDAGTNIGLPFNGSAPDLGCFETDASTPVASSQSGSVHTFDLHQNYPNPFNPETVISFEVPAASFVTMTIYSTIGRIVAVPVSGYVAAGMHTIRFDGAHLPSGIYFCRLQSATHIMTRCMTLIK